MLKYKRIIVKVSGEALSKGKGAGGIDDNSVKKTAEEISKLAKLGCQVGIVCGGGNFWRGRQNNTMDRGVADYVGMLATVMNGLVLGDALTNCGTKNKVVTSLAIDKIAEPYNLVKAQQYLSEGYVVIFAGGTGSPYFSTDTAASLKACEMHADAILCAKNIDGIYDSDPGKNPNAKKLDEVSYDRIIIENLKALDLTSVAMCKEYNIPVIAFGMDEEDGMIKVVEGKKLGTIIK